MTGFTPLLNQLDPGLVARAESQLNRIDAAADATQVNGQWASLSAMPALDRERVDAAVGAALEALAPVPDVLTGTGKSAPLS